MIVTRNAKGNRLDILRTDFVRHKVTVDGGDGVWIEGGFVDAPPNESDALAYLAKRAGELVPAAEIADALWNARARAGELPRLMRRLLSRDVGVTVLVNGTAYGLDGDVHVVGSASSPAEPDAAPSRRTKTIPDRGTGDLVRFRPEGDRLAVVPASNLRPEEHVAAERTVTEILAHADGAIVTPALAALVRVTVGTSEPVAVELGTSSLLAGSHIEVTTLWHGSTPDLPGSGSLSWLVGPSLRSEQESLFGRLLARATDFN